MSSTTSQPTKASSRPLASSSATAQGHPPYASVLDVMIDETMARVSQADMTYLGLHPSRLRTAQQRIFKDYILSPQAYSLIELA